MPAVKAVTRAERAVGNADGIENAIQDVNEPDDESETGKDAGHDLEIIDA